MKKSFFLGMVIFTLFLILLNLTSLSMIDYLNSNKGDFETSLNNNAKVSNNDQLTFQTDLESGVLTNPSEKYTEIDNFSSLFGRYGGAWNTSGSYSNSNYFANYSFAGSNPYGSLSSTDLSSSLKGEFNDDGDPTNGNSGNDISYYQYMNIYLSPNIVTLNSDSILIQFSTYDLGRYKDHDDDAYDLHKKDEVHRDEQTGYKCDDVIVLRLTKNYDSSEYLSTSDVGTVPSDNNYFEIDDFVRYDRDTGLFDGDSKVITSTIKFRATYQDNPIGESDVITIWTTGSETEHDVGSLTGGNSDLNINFFKPTQFKDESFSPLAVQGTFYLDTINGKNIEVNESLFMQTLSQSILNNKDDLYFDTYNYKYDDLTEKWSYVESNETNGFDKINFSYDNVTYDDLSKLLFQDVIDEESTKTIFEESLTFDTEGSSVVTQEFFKFTFDTLNNDNDPSATSSQDDNFIYYGNGTISDEFDNYNDVIKSSALTFTIDSNELYKDKYNNAYYEFDPVPYGIYNDDLINKGNNTISLNLPFYHWEISTINNWLDIEDNEVKTKFNNDASFNIEVSDDFSKQDVYIDIKTNSNLNFKVYDDPNVYSISKNGKTIQNSSSNSWDINTSFEDTDEGLDKYQKETFVITYKQKINDSDTTTKLSQKVHLNIQFDSDSTISSGSDSQAYEHFGEDQKMISPTNLAVSTNKEELLSEDGDFEIIDYYEASNDFSWIFSDDDLEMLKKTITYDEYSYTEGTGFTTGQFNREIKDDDNGAVVFYNTGSLMNIQLDNRNGSNYNYWVIISNDYINFDSEDPTSNDRHIPEEWNNLIEMGIIDFDEENHIYSIEYNGQIYYIKDFFETDRGELFHEKAIKKGWSYSEILELQSYMITSLEQEWKTLIMFSDLIIDKEKLANVTSEFESKKHYHFSELQILWDEELENQLTSSEIQELNVLDDRDDFTIEYYYEGQEIPNGLIIDSKMEITVKIVSKKYGKGIGEYEFSFNPIMIEPLALWIKLLLSFLIVFIVIVIVLAAHGILNRKKNSTINA